MYIDEGTNKLLKIKSKIKTLQMIPLQLKIHLKSIEETIFLELVS
jgi:hypothetical protein